MSGGVPSAGRVGRREREARRRGGTAGERDFEAGAHAGLGTDADVAAQEGDVLAYDRQPEADARRAVRVPVELPEGLEDRLQVLAGYPGPAVLDAEDDLLAGRYRRRAHHDAAGGGELDGVVHQVVEDHGELRDVGLELREIGGDLP